MKHNNKTIYLLSIDNKTEAFKSLRSLTENYPNIPYFKAYRSLVKQPNIIINGYTINKVPLL